MRNSEHYVPLSAFATSTRFEIQPGRTPVINSGMYRGCIEVHLIRYDNGWIPSGGNGLALAGSIPVVKGLWYVSGRLALVDGFNEVFLVATMYGDVVVLRPLNKGLGVHYELFRKYAAHSSANRRLQTKYACKASRSLAQMQQRIRSLTGVVNQTFRPTEAFLLEQEIDGTWETTKLALPAITLEGAKIFARNRIAELRLQGWNCGQEDCFRGQIARNLDKEDETTVAWLCKRAGHTMRVTIKKFVRE